MIVSDEKIAVVAAALPVISPIQHKILIEISRGEHDKNIAEKFGMRVEKIKIEEQKLRHLLYARNRCHLVAIAIRYGLIENPNPNPVPLPPGSRMLPYAFFVRFRDALDQVPDPARTVAVVIIKHKPVPLWSIRMGAKIRSTSGSWEDVPATFTPHWIDTHTWTFPEVFDTACAIVHEELEITRRRTL